MLVKIARLDCQNGLKLDGTGSICCRRYDVVMLGPSQACKMPSHACVQSWGLSTLAYRAATQASFDGPPDHLRDTIDIEHGQRSDGSHGAIISCDQEDRCGFANRAIQVLPCGQVPGQGRLGLAQQAFRLPKQP